MASQKRPVVLLLGLPVLLASALGIGSGLFAEEFGVGPTARILLGLAGTLGAVMLIRGRGPWRGVLVVWSALQIPVIILDVTGPLTLQGLYVGFTRTETMTANGEVFSYTGYGVNLVGVVLLVTVLLVARRLRPAAE